MYCGVVGNAPTLFSQSARCGHNYFVASHYIYLREVER